MVVVLLLTTLRLHGSVSRQIFPRIRFYKIKKIWNYRNFGIILSYFQNIVSKNI